jgi:hypothetical protein
MKIRLSAFELGHAAAAGVWRNVSAIRDGRPLENGRADTGFGCHCDGAIGEYVVAKCRNLCWSPAVGRLDTDCGDLPGDLHVKTTTRMGGSLIVRPQDPEDKEYALVVLALPWAHFVGTIPGMFARDDRYWRDVDKSRGIHQAAWFVPQNHLNPPEGET